MANIDKKFEKMSQSALKQMDMTPKFIKNSNKSTKKVVKKSTKKK